MEGTKKPGALTRWYRELQEDKPGRPRRGPLPHLTFGVALVTFFVASNLVTRLAEVVAIIVAYGPHAFFVGGLRITDWKHDRLSNGDFLSAPGKLIEVLLILALMVVAICGADFLSMQLQELSRRARWIGVLLRLVGSAALLLFGLSSYRQGYSLLPLPMVAFIAAVVLMWQAMRFAVRGV